MPVLLKESIYRVRNLPRSEAVLMGRAELLGPEDRDLIESALVRGEPVARIARSKRSSPRAIRKQIFRLGRRIASPPFLDAARALPYLRPEEARLARQYFCQAVSQRELSRQMGVSLHVLRRRVDRLQAEIAAIRRLQRKAPQVISSAGHPVRER
jgi:hypothetical protein